MRFGDGSVGDWVETMGEAGEIGDTFRDICVTGLSDSWQVAWEKGIGEATGENSLGTGPGAVEPLLFIVSTMGASPLSTLIIESDAQPLSAIVSSCNS